MKIDQKMLSQAVAKAQAAQAAALDEEGEPTVNMTVPANIAAQASNARRPPPAATVPGHHPANVGPKPPTNATQPRKGPRRKRNQNQGMMIALIIVGVLIVCCVLAFFAIIVFQPFGSGEPTTESGSENVKTAPKTKKKPSSKSKKGAKASAKDAKSTDKGGAKAKDEQAKDGEDKPDEDAPSKTARVDTESPSDPTPQDAAKAVAASHEALMNAVDKAGSEYRAFVYIELDSEPSGALVFRGNSRVGETPVVLTHPRGDEPVRYFLRIRGYEQAIIELLPNRDRTTKTELNPVSDKGKGRGPGRKPQANNDGTEPW